MWGCRDDGYWEFKTVIKDHKISSRSLLGKNLNKENS